MSTAIAWSGFAGAWLLVAGPIYQAAIELEDERGDAEGLDREKLMAAVGPPPPLSRWWLLLPPLAYILRIRRARSYRRAVMRRLSATQLAQLMHFSETATAWMFVASGAFLIAVKETWELREAYEWPVGVFYALIVGMVVVATANTVMRVRRREDILRRARDGEQERSDP